MVNFNNNVKNIDLNSIFDELSDKDKLEIVFYFYTNSPRRESFSSFFTTYDESNATKSDLIIYKDVTNIFDVFASSRTIIYDMTPFQLFTFIDNHFNYDWLQMLTYASCRSYGINYFSIIFVSAMYGLLEDIDVNSVLRGELKEEFNRVLLEKEYTVQKVEEIISHVKMYEHHL